MGIEKTTIFIWFRKLERYAKYSEQLIVVSSGAFILLGIIARIYAYTLNRSLWLDEAFLASSLVQRNFTGLLEPLDFNQGAPLGFLWLVKVFVYLFGTSEYVLRLVSLVAGLFSIYLFYYVLSRVFQIKTPLLGTAFYATIPFLVYYSIEFKPYMLDACISLLSLILIHKLRNSEIKPAFLFLYSGIIVWLSFPAVFILSSFYLLWFFEAVIRKNTNQIKAALAGGIITAISFLIYFSTLYQNLTANQSLAYWQLIKFPLIPSKISDLVLAKTILLHYAKAYGPASFDLMVYGTPISLIALYFTRFRPFAVFSLVTLLLLLTASSLGKYGMLDRILLFLFPLNALVLVLAGYYLYEKARYAYYVYAIFLLLISARVISFLTPAGVYRENWEVKSLINFIKVNDLHPLYVSRGCVPQFEYYTGYKSNITNIPRSPVIKNNIIYGSTYYNFLFEKPYSWESKLDTMKLMEQVNAIMQYDSVYLLFGNMPMKRVDDLTNQLKSRGDMTELRSDHGCNLYLYRRTLKHER